MQKKSAAKRNVTGILLLDKPKQISSNAALQTVKRIYNARKAGHTGSLDPLASGMLPICFGEATKFSRFLLEADKKYLVTAQLGIKTSTGDAEGAVIAEAAVPKISAELLEQLLAKFVGTQNQIPSMYSALKHQGQPLYQLARQGLEVERKPRVITIYTLELLSYTENSFDFIVYCSKGTYVRTLVEDMGTALGCGAYVSALRRLYVQPYAAATMYTLDALITLAQQGENLDNYLLPADTSIAIWPRLYLSDTTAHYLQQGQAVTVPHAPTSGWVRLANDSGLFLGVGEILNDGRVAPRRLVAL